MDFFPTLKGQKDVLWAPIFVCPIMGSPERLIAAIAVAGEKNHLIASAGGLEKLRCLYGSNADLIIAALQAEISDLDAEMSVRKENALISTNGNYHIISIGDVRESSAKNLRDFASNWLGSISSLHNVHAHELQLVINQEKEAKKSKARGDALPRDVFKIAVKNHSKISDFFSQSIRSGKSKRTSMSDIKVDFRGQKVVANFTAIRPVVDIRREFDRVFKRLWELDVTQARSGHQESDAVKYELLIQKPNIKLLEKEGNKINKALEELASQADDKNLMLRQFSNAKDMVQHLEAREAA